MSEKAIAPAQPAPPQPRPKVPVTVASGPTSLLGGLQRALGNRAFGGFVQAKLTVGAADDVHEQEADRVADAVMRMPAGAAKVQRACASCEGEEKTSDEATVQRAAAPTVQRACASCEEEHKKTADEGTVQRAADAGGAGGASLSIGAAGSAASAEPAVDAHVASGVGGGGRAMPEELRAFFEPRFQHDFSGVRLHTDGAAQASARSLDALAYTVGRDVVFGEGQYRPDSDGGRHLLAHELTHVVQQRGGRRAIQRLVKPENVICENASLTALGLASADVVQAVQDADAAAIVLAKGAEDALGKNLTDVRGGAAVDPAFDLILREELGLTLATPAQFPIIEQQQDRFKKVREYLESGFARFHCRGAATNVNLVGCSAGGCTGAFAFSCPGNRLIVLCQPFWDVPAERPGTILHEPFHIWFSMLRHAPNALRRADASCFEGFARRLAGETPPFSCRGHTAG